MEVKRREREPSKGGAAASPGQTFTHLPAAQNLLCCQASMKCFNWNRHDC